MGLFSKADQIRPSGGSPYFAAGDYVLEVEKALVNESQQGKGPYFVAEVKILESSNEERPPGTRMSWPMYFSKGDVVIANIKSFVMAAMQIPEEEVTETLLEEVVAGDGTSMSGMTVRANAYQTTTRAGNPFTKVTWLPNN